MHALLARLQNCRAMRKTGAVLSSVHLTGLNEDRRCHARRPVQGRGHLEGSGLSFKGYRPSIKTPFLLTVRRQFEPRNLAGRPQYIQPKWLLIITLIRSK